MALPLPYDVDCGVRQRELIFPKLFNLYMNALIEEVRGTHAGCFIGGISFNNISYADDLALLALWIGALNVCVNGI